MSVIGARRAILSRRGGAATFGLSGTSVNDNAAQGTTIGTVSVPAGYTLVLEDDCDGCFQLSGNSLQVGATALTPGWYQPTLGIFMAAQIGTGRGLHPLIAVTPTATPGDISGLVRAWRMDDTSVTVSGSDITSVTGAWGTSTAATGAARGASGQIKPQLVSGGPNGKSMASFNAAGKSRFDFTSTGALAASTVFIVFQAENWATAQNGQFASQDGNNYVTLVVNATGGEFWSKALTARANAGSATTTGLANSAGYFDQRGLQVLMVVFDGANQTPYVNGVAGASSAQTGTMAYDTFGGTGSGTQNGNFALGGKVIAMGIYNKALDATERAALLRCLAPFQTRDFFFSLAGNDGNTGWSKDAPKLAPSAFAASYKHPPGTRLLLRSGDRFNLTSEIGIAIGNGIAGKRGRIGAYASATGLPPTDGSKVSLSTCAQYTGGWTDNLDGTWSRTPGFTVDGVYKEIADGRHRILVSQATSNDDSWAVASGVLTIRLRAGEDANTSTIEAQIDAIKTVSYGADYGEMADIITIGSSGTGALFTRKAHIVAKNCIGHCTSDDWWTTGGAANSGHDLAVYDAGPGTYTGLDITSTSYDAFTQHGGGFKSYRFIGDNIYWHGNAIQSQTVGETYDMILRNVGCPVTLLNTGANNGSFLYNRCYIERAASALAVADAINFSVGALCSLTVNDSHFEGLGIVRGKCVKTISGSPSITLTNCTQSGFSSLT